MVEGFDSYDTFAESISDGFTNWLNEFVPPGAELICNQDGYSLLCEVFGHKLSSKKLRAVNEEQIKALQERLAEDDLKLSKTDVLQCIRGALRQSVGDSQLDHFRS